MTPNLGSQMIQGLDGDGSAESYTQMKAAVMGVVQSHFRPEFINRLDDIVVFHPLDKAQIKEIARIQMRGLERRLRSEEHTSELQSLMRISYAVFCLKKKTHLQPLLTPNH